MTRFALVLSATVAAAGLVLSAQTVTDAQIASIVLTANQVDIDAGKLAEEKSTNPAVKAFAQLMIKDHTGVNEAAADLARRLNLTPQDNPTSQSLEKTGNETRERLRGRTGAAFDRAYVDNEVVYHTSVLEAIDQTLIPNAQNAELRALLVKVRPAFVAHLEHAKKLQASLRQ